MTLHHVILSDIVTFSYMQYLSGATFMSKSHSIVT